MGRPICVKCEVEFRMKIAGIYVKEMYRHNQEVYKVWSADLWECPLCGTQIVFGFGNNPLAHGSDEEEMREVLKKLENPERVVIQNLELLGGGSYDKD